MMRFILALLFLALAFVLQFWFASIGVSANIILASLVTFALMFDIWDLIFFILAAIFIINWQPAFSIEIVLFAALPLAAYLFNRYSPSEAWVANIVAVAISVLVLYLAVAPQLFLPAWRIFAADLVICLIFSACTSAALRRGVNS